jgi:hypothetical protein
MQFENEEQVKQALEIDSWRNLSKEKFMSFVSALPDIDKDVAIAIVGQFPHFKDLATGAIASVRDSWNAALVHNQKSHKKSLKAFERYIDILEREMEREQTTNEDRVRLLQMIHEAVKGIAEKDSENKAWILQGLGIAASAGVVIVAAAFALLGGKAEIGKSPSV